MHKHKYTMYVIAVGHCVLHPLLVSCNVDEIKLCEIFSHNTRIFGENFGGRIFLL